MSPRSCATPPWHTTASRPAATRPNSAAIPASTTASTGRSPKASREVRSAICWPKRLKTKRRSREPGHPPQPFHGYYFRILTGLAATTADGSASRGFGLVAWPARYDATGVMTFVVDQTGVVRQKDVGGDTGATAKAMALYNPDASWTEVR